MFSVHRSNYSIFRFDNHCEAHCVNVNIKTIPATFAVIFFISLNISFAVIYLNNSLQWNNNLIPIYSLKLSCYLHYRTLFIKQVLAELRSFRCFQQSFNFSFLFVLVLSYSFLFQPKKHTISHRPMPITTTNCVKMACHPM